MRGAKWEAGKRCEKRCEGDARASTKRIASSHLVDDAQEARGRQLPWREDGRVEVGRNEDKHLRLDALEEGDLTEPLSRQRERHLSVQHWRHQPEQVVAHLALVHMTRLREHPNRMLILQDVRKLMSKLHPDWLIRKMSFKECCNGKLTAS